MALLDRRADDGGAAADSVATRERFEVLLHRRLGDPQIGRDFLVGRASRDAAEHHELPGSQRSASVRAASLPRARLLRARTKDYWPLCHLLSTVWCRYTSRCLVSTK
jgi:hypothetical protein